MDNIDKAEVAVRELIKMLEDKRDAIYIISQSFFYDNTQHVAIEAIEKLDKLWVTLTELREQLLDQD